MASVRICHVSKRFNDNVVLREFNETFEEGEFITLLGPSGCGKTTMLRIIAGFEKPSEGEVYIGDRLVTGGKTFVPPEDRQIGMVFQSYAVWPHMTVEANVAYPLKIQKMNKATIAQKVQKALEITHLLPYAARYPDQLSGGQQQRVALARALVGSPKLMLLDEPLSNLDAKLRESMRFEIKEIQKALGITVVYVTHDQTEAMAMSDRIFVINRGVVQQSGTPREIYNCPVNPFVADFLGKVDFLKAEAADGKLVFTETDGQSMPYAGDRRGRVDVAVRPENIVISPAGLLHGTLENLFYLGDTANLCVRAGEKTLRIIIPGNDADAYTPGQMLRFDIKRLLVYDDDGERDNMLEIQT